MEGVKGCWWNYNCCTKKGGCSNCKSADCCYECNGQLAEHETHCEYLSGKCQDSADAGGSVYKQRQKEAERRAASAKRAAEKAAKVHDGCRHGFCVQDGASGWSKCCCPTGRSVLSGNNPVGTGCKYADPPFQKEETNTCSFYMGQCQAR